MTIEQFVALFQRILESSPFWMILGAMVHFSFKRLGEKETERHKILMENMDRFARMETDVHDIKNIFSQINLPAIRQDIQILQAQVKKLENLVQLTNEKETHA